MGHTLVDMDSLLLCLKLQRILLSHKRYRALVTLALTPLSKIIQDVLNLGKFILYSIVKEMKTMFKIYVSHLNGNKMYKESENKTELVEAFNAFKAENGGYFIVDFQDDKGKQLREELDLSGKQGLNI
jgi:hypothetical protein